MAPAHDLLCSGLGCFCGLRLPARMDRECLWYASHCYACGEFFEWAYTPGHDAHGRPAMYICEFCKWHGPANPDALPMPSDWMPSTKSSL